MLSKTEFSIFEFAGLLYSSTQNQTGYEYTDIVTGDLDFERVVNEEIKCWRMPVAAQELKQKKIIITDLGTRFKIYTSSFITAYEDKHVPEFELWVALLEHGFELFAWTGQLVPIKNVEDLFEYLFIIEPIKPNLLIEKLGKLNINKDECFLVTTENCSILHNAVFINQNSDFELSYKTHPHSLLLLLSLPYDLLQDYLDSRDQNAPFTIESNLITILKYNCTRFLKKIAYLNPEIHLCRLRTGDQLHYVHLLNQLSSLTPELCQQIKSFRIDGTTIPEQRFCNLFDTLKYLQSLEINKVFVTKSQIDPYFFSTDFSQLKRLTITNTDLAMFHFFMLNNSQNLEQLAIYDCAWNNPDFPLKNNALKSVKIIGYEHENTHNSFLINLINSTECLEALRVNHLSVPDHILSTLDSSKLQLLTDLEINGKLDISDIAFINLCSNLELLIVNTRHDQTEIFNAIMSQCNLPRLRKASYTNEDVYSPRFEGQITHNWQTFNIHDFETKMKSLSPLNQVAQKSNFLTPLTKKKHDGIKKLKKRE